MTDQTSPETETLRAALETIAGWRKVNIQGEYEHGLRDIIRSITDCATTALDASGHAQCQKVTELPPLVDRAEIVSLLEDLASVNLSREACERQARRMAEDLIARGLALSSPAAPALSPREKALEEAALDFVRKVERGDARSTASYAAFKAALSMSSTLGNSK